MEVEGITLTFWLPEIERIEAESLPLAEENKGEESSGPSESKDIITGTERSFFRGRYEDALLSINKAIELEPYNSDLYFGLGIIYYYLGKSQEATSSFKKALTIEPKKAEYYLGLGIVYDSMGLQKEAQEALNKSVEQYKEENDATGTFIAGAFLKKITKK